MKRKILILWLGFFYLIFFYNIPVFAEFPEFFAEEVVITGSAHEEKEWETISSVTVLNVDKLRKLGINYLGQALITLGGAEIKSNGYFWGLTTLNLRGSRSEQVLVLLDGKKINSSQNGVFDFSSFPLDNLERIEIIKFPLSALYGADALGGVVNLITKSKKHKGGEISFLAGSFGERKYFLNYQDSSGNFDYLFNLNFLNSEGFRKNSDFSGHDYFLSFDLNENFGKVSLVYNYQKFNRGIPGSLKYPSETARQDDENNLLRVDFSFNFLENFANKVGVYWLEFLQDYSDPIWYSFSRHKNRNSGIDYLGSFLIFPANLFTGGISYRKDEVESNEIGKHFRENLALVLQDEIELNKNLKGIFGGRFERFSDFGKIFTPRVGLRYNFSERENLKINWSRGFRAPTFNELYWPESFWAGGNPYLKPEEGSMYNFEINLFPFKLKNEFDEISVQISGYWGETSNLINWSSDLKGVWRPQNLASVERKGLEIEFLLPLKNFEIFSNFSWQNVTDTSRGFEVTYCPHFKANGGFYLKNSAQTFLGGVILRYVGWRYSENNQYSQRILPAFLTVDLKSCFNFGQLTLSGGINNVFDTNYEEIEYYPSAGRSFWMRLGVKI